MISPTVTKKKADSCLKEIERILRVKTSEDVLKVRLNGKYFIESFCTSLLDHKSDVERKSEKRIQIKNDTDQS